jgi:deazaflavin-dependent oxidoreductase (nitroreductase family)
MPSLNSSVIGQFRANGGQISQPPMLKGAQLILLTTTGAKTGKPRTVPLGYFVEGPGCIVLWASNMAAATHPAWYLNLTANPQVRIEMGTEEGTVVRYDATAATATGAERERLYAAHIGSSPRIAGHQDQTSREIPVVVVSYTP